jgi:hypothetical protein
MIVKAQQVSVGKYHVARYEFGEPCRPFFNLGSLNLIASSRLIRAQARPGVAATGCQAALQRGRDVAETTLRPHPVSVDDL